jgi:hypothetical protein
MINAQTKIFGIGLSRTGTVSLTAALTELGIAARHYPDDPKTQEELRAGHYRLSILDEVQALTDIPVAPFYRELDRSFPGSRFILTTRDPERWLASFERHFEMYIEHRRTEYDDFILACVYGCLHFSPERFLDVKERHEADVRRYFAGRPGDLLELDASKGGGWEPLCEFLGLPIPAEPYPHRNRALQRPAKKPSGLSRLRERLLGPRT